MLYVVLVFLSVMEILIFERGLIGCSMKSVIFEAGTLNSAMQLLEACEMIEV